MWRNACQPRAVGFSEPCAARDRFAALRRIGIDDFSCRKCHRYLTVVVDHDTGRLLWPAPRRDRKTVEQFFELLGKERCEQIELVSSDTDESIAGAVGERCPNAIRCVHPFHVIKVRHEAPPVRAGCKTAPPGCRGSPVKLRTV